MAMLNCFGIDVGYNHSALKAVADGVFSLETLMQEREQFINTIKLLLNVAPCQFHVSIREAAYSRIIVMIETSYGDDNDSEEDKNQWMLDYYDASTAEERKAAWKKATREAEDIIDNIKTIINCYGSHFEGNLLLKVDY